MTTIGERAPRPRRMTTPGVGHAHLAVVTLLLVVASVVCAGLPVHADQRAGSAVLSQPEPARPDWIDDNKWRNLELYRKIYFAAHRNAWDERAQEPLVEVHHRIEQDVWDKYPGRFKAEEKHALPNLAGFPLRRTDGGAGSDIHRRLYTAAWRTFYLTFPDKGGYFPPRAYFEIFERLLEKTWGEAFWREDLRVDTELSAAVKPEHIARLKQIIEEAESLGIEHERRGLAFPETGREHRPGANNMRLMKAWAVEQAFIHELLEDARRVLAGEKPEIGGIDFSSVQLRYLSDTETAEGRVVRHAFQAQPHAGNGDPHAATGLDLAKESQDAFFVWLSLPTSSFTVNLNPDEPHRIIDGNLGRTDVGRILLEADLQLKKTTAGLVHPDNPVAPHYWARRSSVLSR